MANITKIPEDYEGLKNEYLVTKKELDIINQKLYETRRQLKVREALQVEYQSEIEILQTEVESGKLKHEEKITQLEDTIVSIRSKYNHKVQNLEAELVAKDEEVQRLKADIELQKKVTPESPNQDVNKLLEELMNLKSENENLLEQDEELKLSLEILQKNNISLEEALTEYKEELTNLRESLSCKREELMETNDLVQKLNDELFCLKSELETYKNKPLSVESKGNSLFAEVDDRRVYLQKTINNMKSEYISMKQERAKHLNTITHLRKENRSLCERWKADMEEKEEDQYTVMKSFKDQIEILENLVEKYKEDLTTKPVLISTGKSSEIELYQKMLHNKTNEIEELRQQLRMKGFIHTVLSTSLKDANKELRKWRLEATLKQYQLELQPGETVSESMLTKHEEMEQRVEFKQTKRGPHLASKREDEKLQHDVDEKHDVRDESSPVCSFKEVVIIDDSTEDVKIIEPEINEKKEKLEEKVPVSILKNRENIIETDVCLKTDTKAVVAFDSPQVDSEVSEKENVLETKKVMFSQGTLSPKATDRTVLRSNCKRLVIPKAIFIPSE